MDNKAVTRVMAIATYSDGYKFVCDDKALAAMQLLAKVCGHGEPVSVEYKTVKE